MRSTVALALAALAIAHQPLDLGPVLLFQIQKPHHHIGHLDPGVIDVVLHIDLVATGLQQPDKYLEKLAEEART